MAIYDIAGLKVNIVNPSGRTERQAIPYLSENQDESQVDITVDVDEAFIEQMEKNRPELSNDDWEYMLSGNQFYTELLRFDGILLHSSCIVVDGKAYAFSANPGTGKSTHTALWLKHFGDRAYVLNDDKPAIRLIDGKVYACGTPFSGKFDISMPKLVELAGICFLQRSEDNWIKRANIKDAIYKILGQTLRKLAEKDMDRLIYVLNEIFDKVPIYDFGCNISDDAVMVSYNEMNKNK